MLSVPTKSKNHFNKSIGEIEIKKMKRIGQVNTLNLFF